MRIAMVSIALRLPTDTTKWITVPPSGYSGVHWVVANLVDGLLDLGHQIYLLGAPGSNESHPNLTVVPVGDPQDMYAWLAESNVDVVHDHTCGQLHPAKLPHGLPYVSTHHLTGAPLAPDTCIYLSFAQRSAAGSDTAPVIRIPVNAERYPFRADKDGYLLYLGRVSAFKGAYEAAAFAHAARRRLVLAGPSWEQDYLAAILRDFGATVDVVGEVGGRRRLDLIAGATAVLALSQSVMGPWGDLWCEPGSTVVSEAAASGTPVIGTPNGCLAEIVPPVGVLVPEGCTFERDQVHAVLQSLPSPDEARRQALARWGHRVIAREHEEIYAKVVAGHRW